MDEPCCLMGRTGAPSAPKELLAQEAKKLKVWMKAVKNHNSDVAHNADEADISVEGIEFAIEGGRAHTLKDQNEKVFIRTEVQIILEKVEKST